MAARGASAGVSSRKVARTPSRGVPGNPEERDEPCSPDGSEQRGLWVTEETARGGRTEVGRGCEPFTDLSRGWGLHNPSYRTLQSTGR